MNNLLNSAEVVVQSNPFPHLVWSHFFTMPAYTELLTQLPLVAECQPVRYRAGIGAGERYELWPESQPDFVGSYWHHLTETFSDPVLIESWKNVCAPVCSGYPELASRLKEPLVARLRIVYEHCPFVLQPHRDMPHKLLVTIVYLDQSGGSPDNGTTLYEPTDAGFVAVERLPYLPNTALTTLRTDNSWHGGEWRGSGWRRTLHIYHEVRDRRVV